VQSNAQFHGEHRTLHRRLGELLVSTGAISAEDLEVALAYKNETGVKLGQALIELRLIDEAELAKALRRQGKMLCVNLTPQIIDASVAEELGEMESRRFGAIAINRIAGVVTVALEDPEDEYTVDEIAARLGGSVLTVHAEPSRVRECIDFIFSSPASKVLHRLTEVDPSGGDIAALKLDPGDAQAVPVVEMVRGLLEDAFQAGASGLHFETRADRFVVRFRAEGSLHDRLSLPKDWAQPSLARLKAIAGLDPAPSNQPLHARTRLLVRGHPVDLLVATTPTVHGEEATVRLRDGEREVRDLDDLGLDKVQHERLLDIISRKDGILLASGPAGSGKMTTLYAALQRLNRPSAKIIAIETALSYSIDGITQILVDEKADLNYAKALRSALRQDPDVLLVKEIRDPETGKAAMQAALAGHFLLSALRTFGAAETVTRLVELGLEPFLLADTLRGIVAQRLVRRLCAECKRHVTPPERIREHFAIKPQDGEFYEPVGCSACHLTGFRGRVPIYEVVNITDEVAVAIARGVPAADLRATFRAMGFRTLREEGVRKVRSGETSFSEVFAVTATGSAA
jgi:type II secretory ATPase GspE/PulE/Tfp pilus assembly ATPase PilB-like protein